MINFYVDNTKMEVQKMQGYKICQVGWNDENPVVQVVLLGANLRAKLGVRHNDYVKLRVKKQDRVVESIAVVQHMFKQHVGKQSVALNTKAAEDLGTPVGAEVEVDKALTESEHKSFEDRLKKYSRERFGSGIP